MEGVETIARTYELTHIALSVRDVERSFQLYRRMLGVCESYRDAASIQRETPGLRDVIGFEKRGRQAGKTGGITHFGFQLTDTTDIDGAARDAETAGRSNPSPGGVRPGEPYVFVADPDRYEAEIWYE